MFFLNSAFLVVKSPKLGFQCQLDLGKRVQKVSYSERKSMRVCSRGYAEVESDGNLNSRWWIQYKSNISVSAHDTEELHGNLGSSIHTFSSGKGSR